MVFFPIYFNQLEFTDSTMTLIDNIYTNNFTDGKSNMKKTWKGINEIIFIRPNLSPKLINQIKHLNTLIDDPKLISDTFNDFFINVGTNTDKSVPFAFASPTLFKT